MLISSRSVRFWPNRMLLEGIQKKSVMRIVADLHLHEHIVWREAYFLPWDKLLNNVNQQFVAGPL